MLYVCVIAIVLMGVYLLTNSTAVDTMTEHHAPVPGDHPGDGSGIMHDHAHHDTSPAGHNHHIDGTNGTADTADEVISVWQIEDVQPHAGEETIIHVHFERAGGEVIEQFDIQHEHKLHLIIVSKDLSYFNHVHPIEVGGGVFVIETRFPSGGDFKLIADIVPTGSSAMSKMSWVEVAGENAEQKRLKPDADRTKTVHGKQVKLTVEKLKTGETIQLNFEVKDAQTQQPIMNLQPYLGAVGHVVILSADTDDYLHVHPIDAQSSGPDARFMTTFPRSGLYKMWLQLKYEDRVITVPYVLEVP